MTSWARQAADRPCRTSRRRVTVRVQRPGIGPSATGPWACHRPGRRATDNLRVIPRKVRGCGLEPEPGTHQQPPRGIEPHADVGRIDHVPFGHADLCLHRRAHRAPLDQRGEQRPAEAGSPVFRRHPHGQHGLDGRLGRGRCRDSQTDDDLVPHHGGHDARAVQQRRAEQGVGVERIERRHHPGRRASGRRGRPAVRGMIVGVVPTATLDPEPDARRVTGHPDRTVPAAPLENRAAGPGRGRGPTSHGPAPPARVVAGPRRAPAPAPRATAPPPIAVRHPPRDPRWAHRASTRACRGTHAAPHRPPTGHATPPASRPGARDAHPQAR